MKNKTGLVIEWVCGVVFLCFCFYVFSNYNLVPKHQLQARAAVQEEKQPGEPEAIGPPEFQTEVKDALALMKEKAPNHYYAVCSIIKKIILTDEMPPEATEDTTAWTAPDRNSIYITSNGYKRHLQVQTQPTRLGVYFIPLAIIHETAHQIEYQFNQISTDVEEENIALAAERDFLRLLGLTDEAVLSIIGSH